MFFTSTVSESTHRGHTFHAKKTLARHGKSFSWATHFFSRETAADVAVLYAFCRQADDIADHSAPEEATQLLGRMGRDLKAGHSRLPSVRAFIDLSRRYRIDPRIPEQLLDTVRSDVEPVRIARWDQLIRYAYGVASTVGLMMCSVMGVKRNIAFPFAIDLGIAMQLTNIARDVVEDAKRDRIYIPADMLGQGITAPKIVGDQSIVPAVDAARRILLDRAAEYYRSADLGMRYIPFRPRLAVLTAARLYEAIGRVILTRPVSWGDRAFTGKNEKVKITLGAIGGLLFNPKFRNIGKDPVHDAGLHRAIQGFPCADARL